MAKKVQLEEHIKKEKCKLEEFQAMASLLGRLDVKAAEALPGIIGAILSWVLNKASDIVDWVPKNLWALVVGVRELLYTYMVTKK